ncbi:O-methyltransferase [Neofusicoccum parvum]|uniref:O-methyltransferase n=1 Tax=Neofusicoccum parvum TaxID=310453 RepID=A0ACB5SQ39_9PEZI|nr:O-methyltransferase [Neofusicoccum parvum]
MSSLVNLAVTIVAEAKRLADYIEANELPNPSLAAGGPPTLPIPVGDAELKATQLKLYNAAQELSILTLGPVEHLRWQAWSQFNDNISLQALLRFNILAAIPENDTTTFDAIAAATSLPVPLATRLVRHAALSHVLAEPTPGRVAHTAASLALRDNTAGVRDWVDMTFEEWGPAAVRTVDALSQHQGRNPEEPDQSGFALAFGGKPIFQYLAERPERAGVFGGAMASFSRGVSHRVEDFMGAYDWRALGKGTVVDVGGSHGHISVAISKEAPDLKFVVEDLPGTAEQGSQLLDPALADRISFVGYDMNDVQPVRDADLYLYRSVLLNWPTKYCVKFLKNLVPALKPGAKVLVNEGCLAEPHTLSAWDNKILRGLDTCMLGVFNSNQRTEQEWQDIFAMADKRFKFLGVRRPTQFALLWIIEAIWEP